MPTDVLTTRDAPGYGFMVMTPLVTNRDRWHALLAFVFRTRTAALSVDLALVAARIALAWIFIYYGAGKLFGAFNGPDPPGPRSTSRTPLISIRVDCSRSSAG